MFRLKSETHYKENNVFDYKNVYSYDLNGNIISIDNVTENDTLIDTGISLAIYDLSILPGGFFISLAATVATTIWDDKIEKLKDDFYDVWNNFWNFAWI